MAVKSQMISDIPTAISKCTANTTPCTCLKFISSIEDQLNDCSTPDLLDALKGTCALVAHRPNLNELRQVFDKVSVSVIPYLKSGESIPSLKVLSISLKELIYSSVSKWPLDERVVDLFFTFLVWVMSSVSEQSKRNDEMIPNWLNLLQTVNIVRFYQFQIMSCILALHNLF